MKHPLERMLSHTHATLTRMKYSINRHMQYSIHIHAIHTLTQMQYIHIHKCNTPYTYTHAIPHTHTQMQYMHLHTCNTPYTYTHAIPHTLTHMQYHTLTHMQYPIHLHTCNTPYTYTHAIPHTLTHTQYPIHIHTRNTPYTYTHAIPHTLTHMQYHTLTHMQYPIHTPTTISTGDQRPHILLLFTDSNWDLDQEGSRHCGAKGSSVRYLLCHSLQSPVPTAEGHSLSCLKWKPHT